MLVKSQSATETKELGARLARSLVEKSDKRDTFIFSLEGPLGSGKTTFVKGLASELGVEKRIKSPSFVLVKRYEPDCSEFEFLFHIDCYRLSKPFDIDGIGLEEILSTPKSVVVVEWGGKIKNFLPDDHYEITFGFPESQKELRKIEAPSLFFSYD